LGLGHANATLAARSIFNPRVVFTNWRYGGGAGGFYWVLPLDTETPYILGVYSIPPYDPHFPSIYLVEEDGPV